MGFKMRGFPKHSASALKHGDGTWGGSTEPPVESDESKSETIIDSDDTVPVGKEVCMSCGAPTDDHPYRHLILSTGTQEQFIEKEKTGGKLKKNTLESEEDYQIRLNKWLEGYLGDE